MTVGPDRPDPDSDPDPDKAHRAGAASVEPVHALFLPAALPTLTVRPHTAHAYQAAAWALRVLGEAHRGGHLCLIGPARDPRAECLAIALAVADAMAGGHRPPGPPPDLAARLHADPVHLCGLADAVGLP